MAIFDMVSQAGQGVLKKARTATDSVKLSTQIKTNEKQMEKILYHLGAECYSVHRNNPPAEYEKYIVEIKRLEGENSELQAQIELMNAVNCCPICKHENDVSAKFCVGCGAPLNQVQAEPQGPQIKCQNCGAAIPNDSLFCMECGSKVVIPAEAPSVPADFNQEQEVGVADEMQDQGLVDEIQEQGSVDEIQEQRSAEVGKFCQGCGKRLDDDELFCTECGTKVE